MCTIQWFYYTHNVVQSHNHITPEYFHHHTKKTPHSSQWTYPKIGNLPVFKNLLIMDISYKSIPTFCDLLYQVAFT